MVYVNFFTIEDYIFHSRIITYGGKEKIIEKSNFYIYSGPLIIVVISISVAN